MSRSKDSLSPMNTFHRLQRRELDGKLPNSFWDYHLHAFPKDQMGTNLVIANDIICVFSNVRCRGAHLMPFGRQGKISPLTDDSGKRIILSYPMDQIQYVYYNSYNNSVIIIGSAHNYRKLKILSVEIAAIKAGKTNEYREIYAQGSDVEIWNIDIPNCRGMIYNETESVLKFFDLKEYNEIFTIRLERETDWYIQSRGNMYLLMYTVGILAETSSISLKTYSKLDGNVTTEATLHPPNGFDVHFVTLCGNDTICVQQYRSTMQLIDISGDIPETIQTNIQALCEPYYLDKLDRFLCCTINRRLHVCNMRGDILITFEDHRILMPFLTHRAFYKSTYITAGQDIAISVCGSEESFDCTINISSIITGECLAKITTQAGSQIRKAALADQAVSLTYDERSGEIFTANKNGICCVWSKKFPYDDRQLPAIPAEDMRG